ncbi:MAG: NmrA family NAD(P)-binding protein [Alphaproteobacteria bacterium]
MIVFVSGAGGRTGLSIVPALTAAGHTVRFLTRQTRYGGPLSDLQGADPVVADLGSDAEIARAMVDAEAVYHIPPNMHPNEIDFGKRVVAAAKSAGVAHVVYHSVLHPQVQALTHHWNKLFVEEALIESGLPYTILQPSSYMQNTAGDWAGIVERGVHTLAFSATAKLSLVDLDDVAAVAAQVVGQSDHFGAIYELAGPAMLSCEDKAAILSTVLGRPIRAAQDSEETFRRKAAAAGMPQHVIDTRAQMFAHYDTQGLPGNPNVLRWLLGRSPTTYEQYARRELLPRLSR